MGLLCGVCGMRCLSTEFTHNPLRSEAWADLSGFWGKPWFSEISFRSWQTRPVATPTAISGLHGYPPNFNNLRFHQSPALYTLVLLEMHLFPLNVELRSIQHRTEPPRMYPGPPLCQQINPKKSANNGTLMPVYVLTSNNILLMHRLQCKSKGMSWKRRSMKWEGG